MRVFNFNTPSADFSRLAAVCAAWSRRLLLRLGLGLLMTTVNAQIVYKCGAPGHIRYEASACRGGQAIDVSDPRSPEEQAQALARVARQAQLADQLEAQRLRESALQARLHAQAQEDARRFRAAPEVEMPVLLVTGPWHHRMHPPPFFTARELPPLKTGPQPGAVPPGPARNRPVLNSVRP